MSSLCLRSNRIYSLSLDLEACSMRSLDLDACSMRSLDLDACSMRSLDLEACSMRSLDLEACSMRSLDLEACSMKRGSTPSQSGSRYDYQAKRYSPKHVKPFNRSDLKESLGTAP